MINLQDEGVIFFVYILDRDTRKTVPYNYSILDYITMKFHEVSYDVNGVMTKKTYKPTPCNKTLMDLKYHKGDGSFLKKYKDFDLICPDQYDEINIKGDRF